MKRFRDSWLLVSAVLVSWLFASNHCAILALASAPAGAGEHACCHHEQAPKSPSQPMQCCKSLTTDVPALASLPNPHFQTALFNTPDGVRVFTIIPALRDSAYATGPPGVLSFAEVVLQGSLLSHAPPFAGHLA